MLRQYFGLIIDGMNAFMDNSYQAFIEAFRPFAILLLTTYILICAIMIFTGRSEKPKEMLVTALTAIIISGIVFEYGVYKDWIVDSVIDQTMSLMGFFVGKASATSNASQFFEVMDINFAQIFNMLNLKADDIGWTTGWKINLLIFLLTLVYSALYIVFAIIVIASFFALYVFFIIGGIPLFLAIMPSTRFVFWAWLRAIATYALIPMFAAIVMSITLAAVSGVVADLQIRDGDVWNYSVGAAFFVGFLSIFFLLKCSEFAAALTGGQSGGAGGFISSGITIGALSSVLAARAPTNVLRAWRGAKAGGSALKSGASRLYSKMRGL
jgi:hypothetical protein